MKIRQTGSITDGLFMAGHPGIPVYVLDADRPVVIEGGMAFMAAHYTRDALAFLGGRTPSMCLLTHSHFDHCGAVSYLKRQFPGMDILASQRAREVFDRPNALRLMRELNDAAAGMAADLTFPAGTLPFFEPFCLDGTLTDGETIALADNLSVQVISTPGHTRDSLSYYIPEKRILFASEAVGLPDQTGYIYIDCLVDYDLYYRSHQNLAALDIDVLCLGHLVAFTGQDARRHLTDSLAQCERFRELVSDLLGKENGDIEAVKRRLKAYEYDGKPGMKQPEPAYLLNLDARVKAIARLRDD